MGITSLGVQHVFGFAFRQGGKIPLSALSCTFHFGTKAIFDLLNNGQSAFKDWLASLNKA
jgi:hypothetical protein